MVPPSTMEREASTDCHAYAIHAVEGVPRRSKTRLNTYIRSSTCVLRSQGRRGGIDHIHTSVHRHTRHLDTSYHQRDPSPSDRSIYQTKKRASQPASLSVYKYPELLYLATAAKRVRAWKHARPRPRKERVLLFSRQANQHQPPTATAL